MKSEEKEPFMIPRKALRKLLSDISLCSSTLEAHTTTFLEHIKFFDFEKADIFLKAINETYSEFKILLMGKSSETKQEKIE